MQQILRTRESRADYDEIWDYLAQHDLAAADRMIRSLEAKLVVIASAPNMGRSVEDLAPNLRSFPLGRYLIFYRPVEGGIQLIRVLHGARHFTPEYFPEA